MQNDDNDTGRADGRGAGAVDRRRYLKAVGGASAAVSLAGCLGGTGADVDEIVVGHLAPIEQPWGLGSERALEMAVDELNEEDGIFDADVVLESRDTQAQPQQASAEAERLVEREDIDVLIGTFASEASQSIIDYVAERNVPWLITGSADPRTLTDTVKQDYERYKNVFRTGPVNSDLQAEAQVDYAEFLSDEHGFNAVALVPENAAWTQSFVDIMPDELASRGLEVVYQEQPARDTDDWTPILGAAEEAGAEIFQRMIAHASGPTLPATWSGGEFPFLMEGIHVGGQLPEAFGLYEGTVAWETTADTGAGGIAPITEKTQPFRERYQERYGDEDIVSLAPMYMGINGYDAVHIYKEAVESAGTVDYENDLDAIVDAMLDVSHTGVAGEIELYGRDGEYPHDLKPARQDGRIWNYPVRQWLGDGGTECVYHPDYATADHQLPPWMS